MAKDRPGTRSRLTAHVLALALLAGSALGVLSIPAPAAPTSPTPTTESVAASTPAPERPQGTAPTAPSPTPPLPRSPAPEPSPARPLAPSPPRATPAPSLAAIRPNELGKLMVLEYHQFGDEEERWTRTRANFRKDLEYLYRNGYRLTGLNALLDNRVRVAAGKSPVVLTFDDSNRSQFQFIKQPDGSLKVDPKSAVGILDGFIKEHPDFGSGAVFCILPRADPPNDFFGQKEYEQQKLRYLVQQGHEICNHTLWHANLAQIDDREIVRQLGITNAFIQDAVPGYQVNVFNPPFGVYPKNIQPVLEGTFEGSSYRHRAILRVSGGAASAPNHTETDFLHLPRIQATQDQLDEWFGHFERHPQERYVSDGDPDRVVFPESLLKDFKARDGMKEMPSPDPAYRVFRVR